MDATIFKLEGLPSLVLFRDTDENCNVIVKLRSIQKTEDDLDNFMEEDIVFQNQLSARSFIQNYNVLQAQEWLNYNMEEIEK